jgi:dihydrofolate synthase/folylpolyglutamate synthase
VALGTSAAHHELELPLRGAHQLGNLALAVLAAEALADLGFPRLDPEAIRLGTARCRWPGRLEVVTLPEGRRALFDAAHNPDGARVLAQFLEGLSEPYDLLFGTLMDKEAPGMLPLLARSARRVVLTAPPGGRGRSPSDLASLVPVEVPSLIEAEPGQALERALAGDGLVVATGSLYLVGELRRRLRQRFGTPEPAVAPLFG